jgi:DNA processing protein
VAIVGSRRATDYGMEMARALARGLAASGVTVTASLSDGISVAAQAGALEADGKALTVMDGSLDACPARRRALYERTCRSGCTLAELPCGSGARSWCSPARERTVAGLAELTIVVEADENDADLLGARVAKALARTVAAVPGRVTSPASRGTNRLLMEGAELIRGPADALELLYRAGKIGDGEATHTVTDRKTGDVTQRSDGRAERLTISPQTALTMPPQAATLEPRLQNALEQVGSGKDTPAKLTAGSADAGDTLLALSELELMGLLARGDGDRYTPRNSLA